MLTEQRTVDDFSHVVDVSEGQTLDVARIDVVDILLIFGTQNDLFDTCSLRREDFFFDPTHRKHLAPQGDFSTHRDILSDLSSREGTGQSGEHGDASAGPIFGDGTLWHVDVHIPLVKDLGGEAKPIGVGLEVLQRNDGRFLHDLSKIAGQGQFALPPRQ